MFRQLRKAPGFTAVSIVSLALGIGATTTVFSVIYGALIAPYPYRGAGRMVQLRLAGESGAKGFLLLSARQFAEFEKLDVLDGAVAMDNWDMASTGDALPEALSAAHLSPGAFQYFGVPPVLGRVFSSPGEQQVVVLSYSLWQRRYAGARDVLGKPLELDHQTYTIVGVMPPRFRWGNAEVYKPLALTSDPDRIYIVDARLAPGVSFERAATAIQPLAEQFARETPGHFPSRFHVRVSSLTGSVAGDLRRTLLLAFAAVAGLLAICCANVTILSLARGTARFDEFAVRAALGASRGRLIRQLLAESAVLALAGGAAGVFLAIAGVNAVSASMPKDVFPPEAVIELNLPVLAFTATVSVLTGIAFGIAPALHFSAQSPTLRVTAGRSRRRMRDLLVACQMAVTILLLASAGNAIRSVLDAWHTKLGYDPHNVLTAVVSLPDGNYTTYDTRAAFYRAIHRRVSALPGVLSAAVALFQLPPVEAIRQKLELPGQPSQTVDVQETSGDYFAALKIPLLQGRSWSAAETDRAAHVAVVNQEMARRFWPNGDAVGQRFRLPDFRAFTAWITAKPDSNDWLEIVGVLGDTPNRGLRAPVAPMAFVPYTLVMGDSMRVVLRTVTAPLAMARAVREQIRAVDPGQPVNRIQTGEDLLRREGWAREQFVASVFAGFGLLALAAAATGLYSVMTYTTALRSREFGIRMALGARKAQVARLVLGSALRTVGSGAAAGFALTIAFGNRFDLAALGIIAALLFGAAALAALVPARRAADSDPAEVLRAG